MMDISIELHEIQQMVSVCITAVEPLMGSDKNPDVYQLPATNAELLVFSVFDLQKRVKALADMLPRGN